MSVIRPGKEHVLQDDHLPRTLRHRDGAMDQFASAFRPMLRDWEPQHVLVFGESGTGKTCLANYATREFEHNPDLPFSIRSVYIDCWGVNTRFQLLHEVVSAFDPFVPEPAATDTGLLIERMESYDGPHIAVIIDEAELLKDPHIIRDYHDRDNFSIVLIATDREDFFASWPQSEINRLAGPRISLEKYPLSALVSILKDRVDEALEPGVIDTSQLRTIANYAAGDAQQAITMLRLAAAEAQSQRADGVTDETIEHAARGAGDVIEQKRREKLKPGQRVLYDVVMDSDEGLSVSEVFVRYKDRVGADTNGLKNNKQVRRYLKKLAEYDLIAYSGNTSARKYHRPA